MKRSGSIPAFFMFCVLVLSILACQSVGAPATVAPTQPPPPVVVDTAAPVDTATPVDTVAPPTQPAAEQYFTEEFDNDSGNWSKVVNKNAKEGDTSLAKVSIEGGRLKYDLDKWLIAYNLYDPFEYTNVRIDAHVENRGTNTNNILLICRASSEGFYLVNIANSGLFAMYAYDGAKDTYRRLADGGSKKIKPGKDINDYGLVCKDRDLILYINGNKTRQFTENEFVFRSGKIGIGIASEDQLPVKVEFDSVKISQP
jgi:hypothetical protein